MLYANVHTQTHIHLSTLSNELRAHKLYAERTLRRFDSLTHSHTQTVDAITYLKSIDMHTAIQLGCVCVSHVMRALSECLPLLWFALA